MIGRRSPIWLICAFVAFLPYAYTLPANEPAAKPELVMSDGDRIVAETQEGRIAISAGPGLHRTYEWDGAARSVELWPRTERWYGNLGAYYPGPGNHWKPHKGISRAVVEEGWQDFGSVNEFLDWVRHEYQAYLRPVYTPTGLMVGWKRNYERRQLSCNVYQISIKGKKPSHLLGSDATKIQCIKGAKSSDRDLAPRQLFIRSGERA
jgi:hypothetical protein